MMYEYRMQQLLHIATKRGVITGRQKTLAQMDELLEAMTAGQAQTRDDIAALRTRLAAAEAQTETLRAELRLARERLRKCLMLDEAQYAEGGGRWLH